MARPSAGWSFSSSLAIVLIIAAGVVCYSNSFAGPFLLDDQGAILNNVSIRDLRQLRTVMTGATHATVVGRPLLNLTLAVNYAFSGTENVWDYHAFNLICHLTAGLLLFGVVRRTLLLPTVSARIQSESTMLAFVIALIWTIHPLQTESVTYIVQRGESLVAIFYFLALYCVIRGSTEGWSRAWYRAAIASCAIGMAAKEVMVTAPVVILFYDRVFLAQSFQEIRRLRTGLYLGFAMTWGWLGFLMWSSGGRSETAGFGFGMSSWDYAMTQFGFIVRYLRLALVPEPLVFDYGSPIARRLIEIIPYAIIIAILLSTAIVALRYRPWAGFLGLSFFIMLAPTSSVVPLVTQTVAEHRMYLPLAALVPLLVLAVRSLIDRLTAGKSGGDQKSERRATGWKRGLCILVILAFGTLTYRRNADYRSELTLWQHTARHWPLNPRAHHSIGVYYVQHGEIPRAIEAFSRAIDCDPNAIHPIYSRANSYARQGQYELAIRDFQRAMDLLVPSSPDEAETLFQLGNCYGSLGQHEKALEYFQRAVEVDPQNQNARRMVTEVQKILERRSR